MESECVLRDAQVPAVPCEHQLADLLGIPRQVDGEDGLTGHVIVPTPLRDEQTSLRQGNRPTQAL